MNSVLLQVFKCSLLQKVNFLLKPNTNKIKRLQCLNNPFAFYSSSGIGSPKAIYPLDNVDNQETLESKKSVLEPSELEDLSHLDSNLPFSFTFSAYINKSPILQNLLKLGVDLHSLESKKDVPQFLVRLNFEKDVQPHLLFLQDIGVSGDKLGYFITKNPFIFKESLEDLQVRINYLESKKFTKEMITRIVDENPHWLMFPVERIDERLGYFQKTYELTGNQVRQVAVTSPKLITYKLASIRLNTFALREEFGLNTGEIRQLLLKIPKLFRLGHYSLVSRLTYIYNDMNISTMQLINEPRILQFRLFKIKERHSFLKSLGRAQYNPNLPGYISLHDIAKGTDSEFCASVAKCSIDTYNTFIKSLGE